MADSDVDAVQRLGIVAELVDLFLVNNGVDGDGGFTSLSVSNNKLTLATSDRYLKDEIKLKPQKDCDCFQLYFGFKRILNLNNLQVRQLT